MPQQSDRPLEISRMTLQHASGSGMASLLLVGWLGSRLGWKPRPLFPHDGALHAKLRGVKTPIRFASGTSTGAMAS